MKILYVDLSPGLGGSLVSLERLLGRLEHTEFVPAMLLAARNPAVTRFRAMGVPVIAVPTFMADAAHSTALVRRVKQVAAGTEKACGRLWPSGYKASGGGHLSCPPAPPLLRSLVGPTSAAWVWARTARNVFTRTLPLTWLLYRAIRASRPDLIHINDAVFVNRPALAAAWLAGVPAVCHIRSLGRLGWWDRLWARTVRGLIFVSQWVAANYATSAIGNRQSARAGNRVIYDGLDPTPYIQAPDQSVARAALDLPVGRPIVAVLGRLVPWKGQDLFLRAMRRVLEVLPETLGLVVGEPEIYSLEYEPALWALAGELKLGNAVRFTGHMSDVPMLLSAVDLLAHTSTSPEPFGLVMLEAMAAGRPVVTPAEGGGPDIVVDSQTGRLYEPRNPDALAEAIIEILRNPDTAHSMGQAGRTRVAEHFSLEQFVERVSYFYREVVS